MRQGLNVIGTLSVLADADRAGIVDFDFAVGALRPTTFRVSEAVLKEIKERRSR